METEIKIPNAQKWTEEEVKKMLCSMCSMFSMWFKNLLQKFTANSNSRLVFLILKSLERCSLVRLPL